MTEPNQEIPETVDSDQDLISAAAEPQAEADNTNSEEAAIEAISDSAEPMKVDEQAEQPQAAPTETEAKEKKPAKPKKKRKEKKKPKKANLPQPSYKHEYQRRKQRGGDNGFQLSPEGLLRHFLGCRICCYFLSGVQVLYGREVVERMVHEFDGKWLEVPLTNETRSLMLKTYGLSLDHGDHYVDYSCEVCCRRFMVDLPEPEAKEMEEVVEATSSTRESHQEMERIETAEEAVPVRRTIEEQVVEWNKGDLPLLLVEFKHRR